MIPSTSPSSSPSQLPSFIPSNVPSSFPSSMPSKEPTPLPTPGPTPAPIVIPYKVGLEYVGVLFSSGGLTTKSDPTACDTHCRTAGPASRGGVGWTFYTDKYTENCWCFEEFDDPTSGQTNVNAISGRFVPDGDPTNATCGYKCNGGRTTSKGAGQATTTDECIVACPDDTVFDGYRFDFQAIRCDCVISQGGTLSWDARYDTVFY